MIRIFSLFKRTDARKRAFLEDPVSNVYRTQAHGHTVFKRNGYRWSHNLENPREDGFFVRQLMYYLGRLTSYFSFPLGDIPSLLRHLSQIARSDLVFSSVENVGIPLLLVRSLGFSSTPFLYTSIGLPERFNQMPVCLQTLLRVELRQASIVSCFGFEERDLLQTFIWGQRKSKPSVCHWTYGVPIDTALCEGDAASIELKWDVVTVGADPKRDFSLLMEVAATLEEKKFLVIASHQFKDQFRGAPENLEVLYDVSFEKFQKCVQASRVVALPIVPNCYSGAVTSAFHAMAMGKPVVLSRVGAIRAGYRFEDGKNCMLVEPGSATAFSKELQELLLNKEFATQISTEGVRMVRKYYSMEALEAQVLESVSSLQMERESLAV